MVDTPVVLEPPADLPDLAKARWRVVAPALAGRAVDRDELATYCQAYVRWRQAEAGIGKSGPLVKNERGRPVKNPLIAVSNQARAQVHDLERRLGIGGEAERPATASDGDALVTRRDLAKRLDVHMQTVCKWEQDGMPIAQRGRAGKPSLYDELAVRAWLEAREVAAKTSGTVDVARERAMKERAQAELARQTYQMRQRELVPRVEVERVWSSEVAAVRTKLLAIPQAYADRVHRAATLEGLIGVEQVLKDAVVDALRELSDPERPPQPATPDQGERIAA